MAVEIDMHRWYAIVKDGDTVVGVIGTTSPMDGLVRYESVEDWEASNG